MTRCFGAVSLCGRQPGWLLGAGRVERKRDEPSGMSGSLPGGSEDHGRTCRSAWPSRRRERRPTPARTLRDTRRRVGRGPWRGYRHRPERFLAPFCATEGLTIESVNDPCPDGSPEGRVGKDGIHLFCKENGVREGCRRRWAGPPAGAPGHLAADKIRDGHRVRPAADRLRSPRVGASSPFDPASPCLKRRSPV
jgi:hypothetical protein